VRSNPLQVFNGIPNTYYVLASTLLTHLLPEDFEAVLQVFTPTGLSFKDQDLSPTLVTFNDVDTASDFREVSASLDTNNSVFSNAGIVLGSHARYTIDGVNLTYPGGNLGTEVDAVSVLDPFPTGDLIGASSTPFSGSIIGADIEGQLAAGTEIKVYDDSLAVDVGGISSADIREEIYSAAFSLVRGTAPIEGNVNFESIEDVDFNNNVAYFKGGTVTIGAVAGQNTLVEGVNTIVIEDGNLVLLENWRYGSNNDSLGLILINNNSLITEAAPATGHVFIHNTLQHIVGTYFMDGGFITTDKVTPTLASPIDDVTKRDSSLSGAPFAKQLIFEGTFIGNNTLGGSFYASSYRTPWKNLAATERQEALKFDLHFIRRYTPSITGDSNCSINFLTAACDSNNYAFVIRQDGRAQLLPPPGFEGAQFLRLN
jgi:hypothetical protein